MIVYHYTTIESLAMIMSPRSIKFNRLDKVDDMEECVEPSNIRLWQYIFVSCWTENPEESIPLWRMYSGNSHGVRIGMDIDMFEDNVIGGENVPAGIPVKGFIMTKVPAEDVFREDYFVSPIGMRIEDYAKRNNLGVIEELVGHGVGTNIHEDPDVPNYYVKTNIRLKKGMVLAIEPMLTLGKRYIYMEDDDWTIKTEDGLPSAHFEHTIVVTDNGYEILTGE